MRHLIQICNLATGSKVVSWTGTLNSQLQLRDLRELRNHCVRIYAQLAPLIQDYADVTAEAKEVTHPQSVIIIRGTCTEPKDAYLVCEKLVLSKFSPADVPLMLFATYYVFNMHYCSGCTNFFTFYF